MGIRSSLQNAKHECRYLLYGAVGPLAEKLYDGGFNNLDRGSLENLLGEKSQLPELIAATGALWASYKAGKAIDGKWPRLLRGSVQTLAYTGLIAATVAAGASMDSNAASHSIDYIATMKGHIQGTMSYLSQGQMAPLMYTVLYGGLLTGAARWAKNIGSYVVEACAGKPGPSKNAEQS